MLEIQAIIKILVAKGITTEDEIMGEVVKLKEEMEEKIKKPTEEALIAEYSATNDAYMHYDSYSWQVGVVLIAGVFVFWGFLLDKDVSQTSFFISSLLITLLMSAWIFYTSHTRQIYLSKLHRIQEIEEDLGLKQHLRFKNKSYKTFGLKGHIIDYFIYIISSIGAPVVGIFKFESQITFFIPVIIVIIVFLCLIWNEKLIITHLKKFKESNSTPTPLPANDD